VNIQSHPVRVLLIDDDEDDFTIVRDLLSDLSSIEFILKWVSDYGAALDAILSGEFDVCLLDYRIKERNGLELMQEAVSHGATTPIVFLTGQGGYDLDLEAMSKGAADWLTKGELNATLLERAIRHAMERQRKKEELIKAKRVIQALSECNHAVIHIKDEAELLRAICRIVVEVGGYRMAWVGYAEEGRDRTVTPVAQYGYEQGYLETVNATWKDAERGKGPTGTCIRTGIPSIIRSVTQAEFAPWKLEASKRGYASVIGLPLLLDGRRLGALSIYSSEPDAFDTEEAEFLVKVSSNLSYGIGVLRLRKAQAQAEEALKEANLDLETRVEERTAELAEVNEELRKEVEERRQTEEDFKESQQQLANIIDFLPDATFVINNEGEIIAWNKAMEDMSGVSASDMLGKGSYEYALPFYGERRPVLIDFALAPHEEILWKYTSIARRGAGIVAEAYMPALKTGKTYLFGTASVLRDSSGNIFGAVESIRDITDRKRAEEALHESEVRLKIAMDLAKLVQWDYDVETGMFSFDEQFYALLGTASQREGGPLMSAEAYAGKFVPPEESHVIAEEIAKILATADPNFTNQTEHRIIRADGEERHIIVRWGVVCDRTGRVVKARGANQDITERKRAEDALRESEEHFSRFFHASPVGTSTTRLADSKLADVNDAFLGLIGCTREEVIGKNPLELGIWADKEDRARMVEVLQSQGRIRDLETKFRRKSGEIRDVRFSAEVIEAAGQQYFLGLTHDITEWKRSEEALQAANEQLKAIIEFLPDATCVVDRAGKVTAWNRVSEEISGVRKEKMIGVGDYAYAVPFYGEARPVLIDLAMHSTDRHINLYDCIERQDKLLSGEVFVPNAYGGKGAFLWAKASPLFDKGGNLIGAIEVIRDITDLKETESTLLKREADLEEKAHQLEEINTALKVLLRRREEDKKDLEESLLTNVKESILPFLEKLKKTRLDQNQKTYLMIVESHLGEIVSPFLKSLSSRFTNLTPMEIKVARLIREGRASKEIADILGVAEKTILTHRNNLRAKLGLRNERVNLRSHLMSFT